MKRLIYISNGLYLFSLALWVAGMFLLGILVEIMVRVKLKEQPQLASNIMNGVMDVFNVTIIYWCLGLMLAVMIALALYIGSVLRPQMHEMDALKKANPEDIRLQKQFDGYHSQLTWLYTVNMIFGISLFYIHGKEMTRFREDNPVTGDPVTGASE